MVKFGPNFCYCAVDQGKPLLQNGPFLAHLPFWGPKWSNLARISAIVLQTKKKPFFKGNGRFWPICPFGARNNKIQPKFRLLCCRPRRPFLKRKRAVSGPSALLGPEMVKFGPNFCPLGPEMIKFSPNFCYCAVYQEKVVFKRKRAVSSPSALFGPGRPTRPLGASKGLRLKGSNCLGRFLAEALGSKAPYPANASREASGRPLGGVRGPRKRTIAGTQRLGARFGVPYSRLLASGLPGLPRSPQPPVGLGALSPAGGL